MGNSLKSSNSNEQNQMRTIITNQENCNYPSNEIKSTSTNIITFIPLNLLHQLKSFANGKMKIIAIVYFIMVAVLQSIPEVSVTNGKPTVLIPLGFVTITVLIKDAYEEFYRYLKDRTENNKITQVLRQGRFQQCKWEDVRVGCILRIQKDQVVPCDALVLQTSHKEDKFFLQTKSLDGQTSLKVGKAFKSNTKFNNFSNQQLYSAKYKVQCQLPNHFLHSFQGNIILPDETVSLGITNCLLRGCYLRNVHEVICLCVYSGIDTKVMQNSVKFSLKSSMLMSQINKMVVEICIWQLIIALSVSILNTLIENSYHNVIMQFLPMSNFWVLACSWWLMMTYFVPISLIVTMEVVKLFQGFIISKDQRGYSDQYGAYISANNTSVNQNLGQIRYVFTDKTGTLTKNEMNFKKIIINGKQYGNVQDDFDAIVLSMLAQVSNVSFRDSQLRKQMQDNSIQTALRIICLCHDIEVQKQNDRIKYNSRSPDEIALINFAKLYGKQLIGEQQGFIHIVQGMGNDKHMIKYQKLVLLQFTSDRKRMSVIVRNPATKAIQILTKGADSEVTKLLRLGQLHLQSTQKQIDKLSIEGLRTLMLARRTINESQFKQWSKMYHEADISSENRQQKMLKCYAEIQMNLELIGATAVQDKLQDNVANTIRAMRASGMSFYILTGDKKQTAISIGRSCGLVQQKSQLIEIPDYDIDNIQIWYDFLNKNKLEHSNKVYLLNASKNIPPHIPLHQTICYRCTPVQKQNIVRYVKENSTGLTLAIGDGANDVNMITAADVGVGVHGRQGTQATRVADYAIGNYSMLSFLTLYYGRQWYRKNCQLVSYNFFKNWYHVSTVLVYGAYTYFSAMVIFDVYLYELYNLFFTASPIIIFALFDEQYTYEESLQQSELYQPGIQGEQFNQSVYFQTIGLGSLYGFISIIAIFLILESNVLTIQGQTGFLIQSGSVLYFTIILIVNLKVLVLSNGFSPLLLIAIFGGLFSYWLIYSIYVHVIDTPLLESYLEEWKIPNIYFSYLVMIFFLIMVDFGFKKLQILHKTNKKLMKSIIR